MGKRNAEQIREEIDDLIADAESANEWGGSEDADGRLMPGSVDWLTLRQEIRKLIDELIDLKRGKS